MLKHRSPLGRSRLASRRERRPPAALQTTTYQLAEARRVALAFVRERWPELGCVEPRVTTQLRRAPSKELLKRLGVDDQEFVLRQEDGKEYTFTFARETAADDEPAAPLVATVTVDDDHHIVKALISR
jgi:hypothetical protein